MLQQLRARCASRAWIYHSPANGTDLLTGDRRHEQQASAAKAAGAAPAVLPKLSGSSSGFVFEHRLDLIAKLRTIRMPMRRNSMLHRGIETFPSGSASNLKLSPSFAQKSLCDCAVSTLTPRTTALACSYFARSRWKFFASIVQPLVKSFG